MSLVSDALNVILGRKPSVMKVEINLVCGGDPTRVAKMVLEELKRLHKVT